MKSKKNILIISYAYPPNNAAGAQRPYALAKYLDKTKYNVKVITCENPDLPIGENKMLDPNLSGVDLIKIKSIIGNSANTLRSEANHSKAIISILKSFIFKIGQQIIFPDKGIFWYLKVKAYLKKNKKLIRDTNIIFSTSPGVTNHQIAQYVYKKNSDIRWITDFRDFNYVENWSGKGGVKAFLHKRLEASFVKQSFAITFVTKTMLQAYQEFYPKYQAKMECIYNGFEISDVPSFKEPIKSKDKLKFFYAGSFYNGLRSPLPLMQLLDIAFLENLVIPSELEIQVAGSIDENTKLKMKSYKSYSAVIFLGNLPRTEVLKLMNESSFLWLIVANIKSHYQTVPIKLFEYIAAKRPIINFAPSMSESSHIIQENCFGINLNTSEFDIKESYPAFKDLILSFKKGKLDEKLPDLRLISYKWENRIKQIENIFK